MSFVVIASRKTRIARIHRDDCGSVIGLFPADLSDDVTRDRLETFEEALVKGSERARRVGGVKRQCKRCLPISN